MPICLPTTACVARASVIAVAVALAMLLAGGQDRAAAAQPFRPLVTGVMDPSLFSSPDAAGAFRRVRSAGARTALLQVDWSRVAPPGSSVPRDFDARDPGDPQYDWADVDRQVNLAVGAGLDPIVTITFAPKWSQTRGSVVPYEPSPVMFGDFAHAAATRYSGRYRALPRVKYWQAWNEPNLTTFLLPQFIGKTPASPDLYRRMVNAFATSVHRAAPGNIVIAGAVAPFADAGAADVYDDWGPLAFMRELFCLTAELKPTCSDKITFDVWSAHPYTSGGPTHTAQRPNDVSLGDLPEMRRVLSAAQRSGRIRTSGRGLGFWVTEFSWDSAPPDPKAVPMATLQQWIPRALYAMWQNGVTHVTWFTLRDDPMAKSDFQSGLYFNGGSFARDRPKPLLANFRFPVVLIPQATGVYVWGRTPRSAPGRVVIQTTGARGWRTVGTLTADKYGIFQGRLRATFGRYARALALGEASGRVGVSPIPDRFYNPFGTTPPIEPP